MTSNAPSFEFRQETDQRASLDLAGDWVEGYESPDLNALCEQLISRPPRQLVITTSRLGKSDSLLVAFLLQASRFCDEHAIELDPSQLPESSRKLLQVATAVPEHTPAAEAPGSWLDFFNPVRTAKHAWHEISDSLAFLGGITVSLIRLVMGRSTTRFSDFKYFCYQAGPSAFSIITLTSLLVGMILAYLGAAQLKLFGAEIYVANLVVIGIWREMGVLMVAVVMAGRTGAAYAAQLGTMQTNEEIDAIVTMGVSPMEFLVLPRMLALLVMMPLLTLYADILGVLGGGIVAGGMDINMLQFITQVEHAMEPQHLLVGLLKSVVFAILIATAGCRSGIQSGRGSEAVGTAATEAVVTALVYLIVADAAINILFQQLGI